MPVNKRLESDHGELNKLHEELCAAFEANDLARSYALLDLFWARLAMHIRAEQLHLFPANLGALNADAAKQSAVAPTLVEAQSTIEQLRRDHEFFMHQLAGAIVTTRNVIKTSESSDSVLVGEQPREVRARIAAVEERLSPHNSVEENEVYLWPPLLLSEADQTALLERLERELTNLPSRFES